MRNPMRFVDVDQDVTIPGLPGGQKSRITFGSGGYVDVEGFLVPGAVEIVYPKGDTIETVYVPMHKTKLYGLLEPKKSA